jgi:hypothetical protein
MDADKLRGWANEIRYAKKQIADAMTFWKRSPDNAFDELVTVRQNLDELADRIENNGPTTDVNQ